MPSSSASSRQLICPKDVKQPIRELRIIKHQAVVVAIGRRIVSTRDGDSATFSLGDEPMTDRITYGIADDVTRCIGRKTTGSRSIGPPRLRSIPLETADEAQNAHRTSGIGEALSLLRIRWVKGMSDSSHNKCIPTTTPTITRTETLKRSVSTSTYQSAPGRFRFARRPQNGSLLAVPWSLQTNQEFGSWLIKTS